MIERFVLTPERREGQFNRFKKRRRFYGGEDKINLRLVALVRRFKLREVMTFTGIRAQLAKH